MDKGSRIYYEFQYVINSLSRTDFILAFTYFYTKPLMWPRSIFILNFIFNFSIILISIQIYTRGQRNLINNIMCLKNKTNNCLRILLSLFITGNLLHFIEFHAVDNAAFILRLSHGLYKIYLNGQFYISHTTFLF